MTIQNAAYSTVLSQLQSALGSDGLFVEPHHRVSSSITAQLGTKFAWTLRLGELRATYTNAYGVTVAAEVELFADFHCTFDLVKLQAGTDLMSTVVSLFVDFGGGGYVPPVAVPGDHYIIDSLALVSVTPPIFPSERGNQLRTATYSLKYHAV